LRARKSEFAKLQVCGVASKIRLQDPSFVVLQAKSDCEIRVLMSFVVTRSFDASKIRVLMSLVVTRSFDASKIRVCQDPISW
jgi:hypothetical protein